MNKNTQMLDARINDNLNLVWDTQGNKENITNADSTVTAWRYWQEYHYPHIRESYPVYIQEKSKDKGKQAYEIIKILKDKKLINLERVSNFIDIMDELIKIL